MGYALFTQRKMSLQAEVNQLNLKLMQLTDKQKALTNKSARQQKSRDRQDAFQNRNTTAKQNALSIVGNFGTLGQIASTVGNAALDKKNEWIDTFQDCDKNTDQTEIAIQQQEIDTEKARVETLLQAASQELQDVKKAESEAIKNSSPSYCA